MRTKFQAQGTYHITETASNRLNLHDLNLQEPNTYSYSVRYKGCSWSKSTVLTMINILRCNGHCLTLIYVLSSEYLIFFRDLMTVLNPMEYAYKTSILAEAQNNEAPKVHRYLTVPVQLSQFVLLGEQVQVIHYFLFLLISKFYMSIP